MKQSFEQFKAAIKGKRVAVVGVGVSNTPLIKFLLKLEAKVTAFDRRSIDELTDNIRDFAGEVEFSTGADYLSRLQGFDYIFRTPGMRPDMPELIQAKAAGAIITSEMREFIRHCPGKTIGITGSDGKSTTTTMTYNLIKAAGLPVHLGGNIGFPLFDQVEAIKPEDYVVLELSSFQLMDMDVSTDIAVVTNLSPNHLDVHKDMAEYIEAKKAIFRYQDESGVLILNQDNPITEGFAREAKGTVKFFSSRQAAAAHYQAGWIHLRGERLVRLADMKLRGVHNAENLCAAILATEGLVSKEVIREFASAFPGVHHRCEFVRDFQGVRYYNDSIASSPTRTMASVKAFEDYKGRINIILGGYDKNLDYAILADEGAPYFRNVILVGATKFKIQDVFLKSDNPSRPKLHIAGTFEEAVQTARQTALPGDLVMMSPASASFDMFKNFEYRGEKFKDLVEAFE